MIVNKKTECSMKRKGNSFVAGAVLATVFLLIAAVAQAGPVVVYENVFDGTDRGDNPGIGGGMDRALGQAPVWELDTDTNQLLAGGRGTLNDRGNVFTVNSFDLTGGFRLVLEFSIADTGTSQSTSNRLNFGLAATDHGYEDNYLAQYLLTDRNTYGIGLNMTTDAAGNQGLIRALDDKAGGSELVFLSNDQDILENTMQTLVIEVDATGTIWSYSIGGNPPTTGTFAEGQEFDFSREYQIFGYTQRGVNEFKADSVKLTVIPEPASMALLGLGSVVMLSVRRRR